MRLEPVPDPDGSGRVTWVPADANEAAGGDDVVGASTAGDGSAVKGYAPEMPEVAVAFSLGDWGVQPGHMERQKKRVRLPPADPRDEDGRRRFVVLDGDDVDAAMSASGPLSAETSPRRNGGSLSPVVFVTEPPFKHHPIIPPMPPGMTYSRTPRQETLADYAPTSSQLAAHPPPSAASADPLDVLCGGPPPSLSPSLRSPALVTARESTIASATPIAPPRLANQSPSALSFRTAEHPLHTGSGCAPPAVHIAMQRMDVGGRPAGRVRNRNIEPYGLPFTMLAQLCPHLGKTYLLVDVESAERLHFEKMWAFGMEEMAGRRRVLLHAIKQRDRLLVRILPMHEDIKRRLRGLRRDQRARAQMMKQMQAEYHKPMMQVVEREVFAQVLGLETVRERWRDTPTPHNTGAGGVTGASLYPAATPTPYTPGWHGVSPMDVTASTSQPAFSPSTASRSGYGHPAGTPTSLEKPPRTGSAAGTGTGTRTSGPSPAPTPTPTRLAYADSPIDRAGRGSTPVPIPTPGYGGRMDRRM